MLNDRFFVSGLLAFFLGCLLYIVGFGRLIPPAQNYFPGLILFGVIFIVSLKVILKIIKSIKSTTRKQMKTYLLLYSLIISLLLYSASLTLLDSNWNYISALWVVFGALFFYVSDVMNAWNRFVSPVSFGSVKIMISYHFAQIAMGIGVVLHYVYPPDS